MREINMTETIAVVGGANFAAANLTETDIAFDWPECPTAPSPLAAFDWE